MPSVSYFPKLHFYLTVIIMIISFCSGARQCYKYHFAGLISDANIPCFVDRTVIQKYKYIIMYFLTTPRVQPFGSKVHGLGSGTPLPGAMSTTYSESLTNS